ncbi:hypothetical protein RHGRI_033120 [Rhododendron griersonianum]|uniref:BED-type domain-containing protein n=1 Tax=Rhododendron griersonianum TaxID=479676 RepID=A0AAV6HVG1_9ERIC|nr:hypothetical protein RHGRI_033120 [Rhododendron griersonianum]
MDDLELGKTFGLLGQLNYVDGVLDSKRLPSGDKAIEDKVTEDDDNTKLRSPYWAHYNRVKIAGVFKAICKYCGAKINGETKNGTSHLSQHYIRKHQKKDTMRQQVLTNNLMNKDRPPLLTSYSFDHGTARKELAHAIIMHEYPLSIVDHVGFKRYSNALQPLFKVPCRNTMKSEIFKIYEHHKGKTLSLVVSNASRLAITTDMWTSSNQKKGFMAVTAHFIDDSWTRILRFIYVPCPHTKEVLCEQLLNCLMDWNIDRKISSITVDNCSTNDAMIDLLWDKLDSASLMLGGDLFHMRCCAHILNLIVKDGLDVIKVGIEKIRDSVAYWTASQKREEKFEETVRQLNVGSTKKLGLDCATRWNSTFLMLQTALLYKDVFNRLSKRDAQYNSLPSEREWGFARDVCQKLNFFFKVTELFSGTKYPTTNQCFPNICEIRLELRDWLHSENQVIREMAKRMVEKFDKYWSVVHGVVGVSAVLDPRYKINVLEFYFKLLFPTTYKEEVEKVRALCYKLLKEYQNPSSMMEGIGDSSSQLSSIEEESLSKYDVYMLRESKRKISHRKSASLIFLDDLRHGFSVHNHHRKSAPSKSLNSAHKADDRSGMWRPMQWLRWSDAGNGLSGKDDDCHCRRPAIDLSLTIILNLRPEIPRCCPISIANVMIQCWDANPDKRPNMDELISLSVSELVPPWEVMAIISDIPMLAAELKLSFCWSPREVNEAAH